jgi:hypothetical protein
VLGFVAGREGVADILHDLMMRLPRNDSRTFLPTRFGTFFTPTLFDSASDMGPRVQRCVDQQRAVLARPPLLAGSPLSPQWPKCGCLEWIDMGCVSPFTLQAQRHEATFHGPLTFNSLTFFIWAGFQAPRAEAAEGARMALRSGAAVLPPPTAATADAASCGFAFTSALDHDPPSAEGVKRASNWRNLVMFLGNEWAVAAGCSVTVTAEARLRNEVQKLPTYVLTVRERNAAGVVTTTEVLTLLP